MENIALIVMLLFGITFLAVLTNKYRFPFPIALVLCGVAISLVPGLPVISLQPEIVFLVFLPPLLYGAAWNTSWHDFKANKRSILLAGIGLVLFTTSLIAVAAHALIPGISWPLAFLLGAIVSPPDAVAATSITKGLGLHPRIIAILEGESLVNDASGLITYKYALIAMMAANFTLWQAGMNFLGVVIAGVGIGLLIGYLMYLIHKNFICDPIVEVTLTFLTPFAAYLLAEHFHVSGVLAVVTTGLYLSFRSGEIFTHQSRIMAYAVWDVVMFILNGLIFILIGLQLRSVMEGISGYDISTLLFYGVIISVVTIVVRFVWTIPAALLPRVLSKRIRERESFDRRNMVIFGWAGMRGVVSMAAALAIPLTLADGSEFPMRDLLIFLTFFVILVTLVLPGLTLPWIIRKLKLPKHSIVDEEYEVRTQIVSNTNNHIEEKLSYLKPELLNSIKNKYEVKYNRLQRTELPAGYFEGKTVAPTASIFNELNKVQLDLIGVERDNLQQLHRNGKASEEIIRKIERELDLEEAKLRMEMYEE